MRNVSMVRRWSNEGVPETRAGVFAEEEGMAVLIALVALSIFSAIGMYMSVNATTELRISENFESKVQSDLAARAGINHARELVRGLQHNDLLQGPDGSYSNNASYKTQAKTYSFRNFVDWTTARSLNVLDPSSSVSGLPDDG